MWQPPQPALANTALPAVGLPLPPGAEVVVVGVAGVVARATVTFFVGSRRTSEEEAERAEAEREQEREQHDDRLEHVRRPPPAPLLERYEPGAANRLHDVDHEEDLREPEHEHDRDRRVRQRVVARRQHRVAARRALSPCVSQNAECTVCPRNVSQMCHLPSASL